MNATKTPAQYAKIIERQKKLISKQAKRIKELEEEELKRGAASILRAEAYKEGYNTCRAQDDQEKQELKLQLAFYEFNIQRFLRLEVPVSETYRKFKEGF